MTKRDQKKKNRDAPPNLSTGEGREISPFDNKAMLPMLLTLALSVASYVYIFDEKLDLGGDNIAYYLLGKSLAGGDGFVTIWSVGNPPQNHFPPGYPAIIALIMALFSDNFVAMNIANGLFFFLSLMTLFLLFNRFKVGLTVATIATLAIGINAHLLRYATIMMSEIPFLFFSTLALYITTGIDFTRKPYREKLFFALLTCLGAAYYIRTLALAAVFGVIVYFILKKQWPYVLSTVVGFALLAVPWFIRGRLVGGGNPYLHQLVMVNPYNPELGTVGVSDILKRFFSNVQRYVSSEIPNGCLPFLEKVIAADPILGWTFGIMTLGLLVYGMTRLRVYQTLLLGYLAGTFGITLFWPEVWYGPRFILAAIPLLTFLLFFGLYEFLRITIEGRLLRIKVSPLVLSPLLLLFFAPLKEQHLNARSPYPANWTNYFRVAAWVRQNTPPGTVVSCRKWEFFYLFSERPVTAYAFTNDDKALIEDLEKQHVDYVVVDQLGFASTPRYLVPAIQKHPDRFRLVIHLPEPDTFLFQFLRP